MPSNYRRDRMRKQRKVWGLDSTPLSIGLYLILVCCLLLLIFSLVTL